HGTYTLTAVGAVTPGSQGPYMLLQYIEHQEPPATGEARFRYTNVVPHAPPQQTPDLFTAPVNFRAGVITAVWTIGLFGGTGDQRVGYFICDEIPAASGGQTTCTRARARRLP